MLSLYKKDESLLLVGPYPNPLGGVSVHTKRLLNLIKKEGFNVSFYNLNKKSLPGLQWIGLLVYLMFNKYDTIHIQLFEPLFYKIILKICRLKKTRLILTIHNPKVSLKIKNNSKLLNQTDTIVVVGEHIIDEFKKGGVILTTNLKVIPSYLPPTVEDEQSILKTYPKALLEFIEGTEKLMLISAYKLILVDDEIDLYGIDQSIDLLQELIKENNSTGLIIAIGDPDYNKSYLDKLKLKIDQNNLSTKIFFLVDQKEIWPLFKRVNLFLRPTYYDGFGISVAEAIQMGCKAIASDVCKRAEGTILYHSGDTEDLLIKTRNVLRA